MQSLRELQTRVVNGLLAESPDGAAPLILAAGMSAGSRLRIYQNNVRTNFVEALRSTYPVIWRLVGAEYFRRAVGEFQRRHPSQSGDLNHAGGLFPDHLRALHPSGDYGYLADVARLEWLIQDALLAEDHGPLDLQRLARVDTAGYDILRFTLHPTLRLFQSEFPALRIWEANAHDADPSIMDPDSGGERVAVMRTEGQLRLHRLAQGEYDFLQSLADGKGVAESIDCAAGADSRFDATLALYRFVAAHAIVDFAIHDTRL
jgi:hypothetical protein